MCRSKSKQRTKTHAIAGDLMDDNESIVSLQLLTVKHHSSSKRQLVKPVVWKFCWGGVDLYMEVDTESLVCVISRDVYN